MKEINQPYLSVDVVTLRLTPSGLEVLLSKRWAEPFVGKLALPGVLLLPGETIKDASYRALKDKADIDPSKIRSSVVFNVFDETNRDPRGATISVVCFVFIDPEANTSGEWIPLHQTVDMELPFDHNNILAKATKMFKNPSDELVAGILGEKFTSGDYALLVEFAGVTIDRTNLSRIIESRLNVTKSGSSVSPLTKRRGTQWTINI